VKLGEHQNRSKNGSYVKTSENRCLNYGMRNLKSKDQYVIKVNYNELC
jgi:hypothetical protein